MGSKSSRRPLFALPARRPRPIKTIRPLCDQLEDRTAPALFNVLTPLSYGTGVMNNNGCVAVADLDKNGFPDAIFSNYGNWDPDLNPNGTTGNSITILYRQNATTFSGPLTKSTGGETVSFVTVGDINGDTWPDVVAVNSNKQSTGSVSVFKNDGAGNLSLVPGSPFSAAGNNTSWVGLADVTGDSILDIVCGSFGKIEGTGDDATITGANITIFQGNATDGKGNFTFSAGPTVTLPNPGIIQFVPTALAVEDFDGDGNKDIAAVVPGVPPDFGQPYPNGSVYVFKGTGSGGFAAPNQYDSGGTFPVNIQAADVNGDSKPDLVIANAGDPRALAEFEGGSVGVILNFSSTGNPSFGVTNTLNANCYGTFAVSVADFDLDGKKDIAAVNYGRWLALSPDAFVSLYMGKGNGTFDPGSPGTYDTQTGDGGGQYLAAGDFDKNGTPDLIVAHANNRVGVMINTTVAGVATTTALGSSQNPSTTGQSVTFTATVSAQSGTPSGGTVTFFRNGVQIGSPVNLANQQAQITTSFQTAGTYAITATYSGAPGFAPSPTSNTVSQVVNPAAAAPTVTINQANGQPDPTNGSSVAFTVRFSETVTGFDGSDVAFTGSTVGGTLAAGVTGSGQDYSVSITGMTGQGDVVVSIPAGAAVSGGGTPSAGSTSTDNKVKFDAVAPAVTIDQAGGQADPTGTPSVKFDVKFSEPVTGFDKTDVSLAGSTAGGTLVADVTGSGTTYTVTVTGMTTGGTVVASIPAGGATDGLNTSLASTSTDNTVTFFETGTVAFSKAVFTGTEDAGFVELTVTRSGPTNGVLTVDYSTKVGTAHTGGSPTSGQNDFTPVTDGKVTWVDGIGGPQTIKIPILQDTLNEGTETFTVTLSNPVGGSLGLADTATAAIAPSDGRVIDARAKVPSALFFDAPGLTGDKVTVRLAGLKGTATAYLTDPDGDRFGPIEWIDLDGTDAFVSKLYVTVVKPRGGAGDGRSQLGEVSGDGVRAIIAPKTDLNGTDVLLDGFTGIHLDGFLRKLSIGNISGGADITVGAPPPTILAPATRIQAGVIDDGTDITVPGRLYNLLAVSIGDGTITAASAGVIAARGKAATLLAPAIPGNFKSDVFISGVGVAPTLPALAKLRAAGNLTADTITVGGNLGTINVGSLGVGNLTGTDITVAGNLNYLLVAGNVNQATVDVQGNVLSVLVRSFWNSRLDAGYTGDDDGSGMYDLESVIGSFRVTGALDGFQSSNVIATTIKSVVLRSVHADNNGTPFGVTANRALKALRVTNPVQFWAFDPLAPSPQTGPALGDFLANDRNGPLP